MIVKIECESYTEGDSGPFTAPRSSKSIKGQEGTGMRCRLRLEGAVELDLCTLGESRKSGKLPDLEESCKNKVSWAV